MALFWVVTQRVVVILTDVSGQYIDPIFRGQETSVRIYHYLLRKNLEERSPQVPRSGSLKSYITNNIRRRRSLVYSRKQKSEHWKWDSKIAVPLCVLRKVVSLLFF